MSHQAVNHSLEWKLLRESFDSVHITAVNDSLINELTDLLLTVVNRPLKGIAK